jgi:hypothetical protein
MLEQAVHGIMALQILIEDLDIRVQKLRASSFGP